MINLSQETEALARRLAAAQSVSIDVAVRQALEARAASSAFRYGKGFHPAAWLNLSDCAAYTPAKTMNAPLLFKGDDLAQTDLQSCL